MKISPTMLDVLKHLAGGQRLHRWPGGYWTTWPWERGKDFPFGEWHTDISTIRALERRGLVERCFADDREWCDERRITEAGLRFLSDKKIDNFQS